MKKQESGITLIALVVTIVVLLILAGVAIATLGGENGIIAQAQRAKKETDEAAKKEEEQLDSMLGEIDESLNNQFNGEVNKPKISGGMIPVKYNGTNWVICSENDEEWYDYENKEWANVMLSDGTYKAGTNANVGQVVQDTELGSMFVWIPRYAYSITEYKTAKDGEGTTQNITNVSFLVGATNRDKDGNVYRTDYNTEEAEVGKATEKIVHPAFKFDGKQLTGIWSAKFEASMAEENLNTTTNNDVTTKTVKIVPNAESWRYIKVGNAFTNCLNMKSNSIYGLTSSTDSHLMKNSEWGAVTYLAVSQYGQTPTINSSEQSGNGDYKTNVSQSTTGNITGIYDMNGGAWEFVAAYWDNGNDNLSTYGTTEVFSSNKLKEEYEKYWDKYEVTETEIVKMNDETWDDNNSTIKSLAEERYNLMKNIKGDAMYEVINTYSYYGKKTDGHWDWGMDLSYSLAQIGRSYYNEDFALIGGCSLPFLLRGGTLWDDTDAGVFAFSGHYAAARIDQRFPPGFGCCVTL